MLTHRKNRNRIVDATLLIGFLLTFAIDLTGLSLHQWLGVWVAALAGYHLILHWGWCKAVTVRFAKQVPWRTRACWLLDAGLLAGFIVILATGLAIATWWEAAPDNYEIWSRLHSVSSYFSLLLLAVKIAVKLGLRWRRFGNRVPAEARLSARPAAAAAAMAGRPQAGSGTVLSRRQALSLIGIAGLGALLAVNVFRPENDPVAAASPVNQPLGGNIPVRPAVWSPDSAPAILPVAAVSTPAAAGTVRCGKRCASPRCRRYVDGNRNGLCDLGESL
ncbi:MAG: ferric reductase-like transmembrane domain-containing protein [Deltaproteobacteria bacterium]|nr:ferric reductase-like transmembrane domain-containing protein [Deltaproteobacteria bacterium]